MKEKIKLNFVDFWHPETVEKIKENYLYRFLARHFDLELTDAPDFIIYSNFGRDFLKYDCVRIFHTGENVRPNFDDCDYAFTFDYPMNGKNYRTPLYRFYKGYPDLKRKKDAGEILKSKTGFCNFVYSNDKAKERIAFFKKLQEYKPVDSGGRSLNNIGYRVDNKIEFQRNYKFTIAFENDSHPGYVTEKILHAFNADTIPIYWGNPWIERDFNPKSFINCHNYPSYDQVIDRIIEIEENDELFLSYLSEPPLPDGKELDYLKEDAIVARFEKIFSNKEVKKVATKKSIAFKKKIRTVLNGLH